MNNENVLPEDNEGLCDHGYSMDGCELCEVEALEATAMEQGDRKYDEMRDNELCRP